MKIETETYFNYEFSAIIDKYDFGKYYYTVIYLPSYIIKELPFKEFPRLRIEGEIDEIQVDGAFMPDNGIWYFMVPKRILKQLNKRVGDEITLRFKIADQDAVELPLHLQILLRKDKDLNLKWESLTPGKRRGLAYKISQAKTQVTINKRLDELKKFLNNI